MDCFSRIASAEFYVSTDLQQPGAEQGIASSETSVDFGALCFRYQQPEQVQVHMAVRQRQQISSQDSWWVGWSGHKLVGVYL